MSSGTVVLVAVACGILLWALAALSRRKRQRQELRELLGPAYDEKKVYVRQGFGIALDEPGQQFVVAQSGVHARCLAADILEVEGSTNKLYVSTRNLTLPIVRVDTFSGSERLAEIGARLKVMKSIAGGQSHEVEAVSSNAGLERAVMTLAEAVMMLAAAVRDTKQQCLPENEAMSKPPSPPSASA